MTTFSIPVVFTRDEADQVLSALKSRERGLRAQDNPAERVHTLKAMDKMSDSIASELLRTAGNEQRRIRLETPPAFTDPVRLRSGSYLRSGS
jgi:hypothetical protein